MDQAILSQLQAGLSAGKRLDEMLPALLPDAGDNPTLSLMTQWLNQRSQRLEEKLKDEEERDDDSSESTDLAALHDHLNILNERLTLEHQQNELRGEHIQHLETRLEHLGEEVNWNRTLLDELALALGACPACWGEDESCRLCRGRGQPGFLAPDTDAFVRIVAPVLQRWPQAGLLSARATTLHAAAGPVRPARMTP